MRRAGEYFKRIVTEPFHPGAPRHAAPGTAPSGAAVPSLSLQTDIPSAFEDEESAKRSLLFLCNRSVVLAGGRAARNTVGAAVRGGVP